MTVDKCAALAALGRRRARDCHTLYGPTEDARASARRRLSGRQTERIEVRPSCACHPQCTKYRYFKISLFLKPKPLRGAAATGPAEEEEPVAFSPGVVEHRTYII